jgi:hypothetical protein
MNVDVIVNNTHPTVPYDIVNILEYTKRHTSNTSIRTSAFIRKITAYKLKLECLFLLKLFACAFFNGVLCVGFTNIISRMKRLSDPNNKIRFLPNPEFIMIF